MANEKDNILSTDEVDPEIDAIDVSGVNAPAGLTPEAGNAVQDQDYEHTRSNPDTEGYKSPMSPLFDAYKSISEGYARFLESPAYTAAKVLSNIKFDPNQMALLHNYQSGHEGESIGAGVLQGFLSAVGMGGEGGGQTPNAPGAGMSGGMVDAEKAYQGEQKAAADDIKMKMDAEKDLVAATNKVMTNPTVIRSNAQLAAYNDAEQQYQDLLSSGAKDAKGRPIFTDVQLRAYASSVLQMVRPGARVSASGDVIDTSGQNIGSVGEILGSAAALAFGGNQINFEADDIQGLKSQQESLKKSAIKNYNNAINFLSESDKSKYIRPDYSQLLIKDDVNLPDIDVNTGEPIPDKIQENIDETMLRSYGKSQDDNAMKKKFTPTGSATKKAEEVLTSILSDKKKEEDADKQIISEFLADKKNDDISKDISKWGDKEWDRLDAYEQSKAKK